MSVRLSVLVEQLGSHWTDFDETLYLSFFSLRSVEKIQVSLKYEKNNGYFYIKMISYLRHLAEFFLEWEMFQIKVVEKIKTHISCSVTSSRKSCRLWDNVEKYGGGRETADDKRIRRRVACWITRVIRTQARASACALLSPPHTHTHALEHTEICKTFLFLGNSGFVNAPRCLHCLSC
jgi:hypothetical protein